MAGAEGISVDVSRREAIVKKEAMLQKVRVLHETNPMLGHRGVRLGTRLMRNTLAKSAQPQNPCLLRH